MAGENLSSVRADLRDVHGRTIRDEVKFTFVNQRLRSLDRRATVEFKGEPVTIPSIPAFPTGLYQVFITPRKYREKRVFLNVPSDEPAQITETVFIEPDAVTPVLPTFDALQTQDQWTDLRAVLQRSEINEQRYAALDNRQKAGLFNLFAKMHVQDVSGNEQVFDLVESITEIKPARLNILVKGELLELVRAFQQGFHSVPGTLHDFPTGWERIDPPDSFKTFDRAGNLQLTFAQNPQGAHLVDADLDDHQGIEHAFDVLKHKFTGRDTHPYDIHQILVFFQGIDPRYDFA